VKPHVVTSDEWDDIFEKVPHDVGDQFCYSTEEQVIGTWVDGKPVYQKVFILTSLNWDGDNDIGLSQLNIDELVMSTAIAKRSDDNYLLPLPFTHPAGINYSLTYTFTDVFKLGLRIGSSLGTFSKLQLILQYTKTTD
jgi:hypothetical protein